MEHLKLYEKFNFIKKMVRDIVELGFDKIKNKEEHNLFFYVNQFLGETNLSSVIIDSICDILKKRYYQNENYDWIHEKTPELVSKFYQMAVSDATNDIYEVMLHSNLR